MRKIISSRVIDGQLTIVLDSQPMNVTKRQAKKRLGFNTDADLARFFGVGRWAVGQWLEDEPIPELRQFQLRDRRPDLFSNQPKRKRAA
jgi:hypothetical protein